MLAAAIWLATSAIASRSVTSHAWLLEPSRLASKGPLAQPHAIWDSTCDACHVAFAPINGSRWSPAPGPTHAGSKNCTACHAGPAHHQNQQGKPSRLAECHRDHRGRDASLLATDDSACTSCHQNLAAHRDTRAGPMAVTGSVTRFDREHHPDLTASWAARSADPRRINSTTRLHLAAGLTLLAGGAPLNFAQLTEPDRARYGWKDQQPLNSPVQLACASCHESEAVDRANQARRTLAALMLPIVYESHCEPVILFTSTRSSPRSKSVMEFPRRRVLTQLKQLYRTEAVNADPELLRQFVPSRPVPGEATLEGNLRIQQAIDDKVLTAVKLLFGTALDEQVRRQAKLPAGRRGCVLCHTLKPAAGPIVSLGSLRRSRSSRRS